MYGKSRASLWRNLSTGTPPDFFSTILFSEQPFYGNYWTFDSHTNTVISHTFAYSSRWRRKLWQGLLLSEGFTSYMLKIKDQSSKMGLDSKRLTNKKPPYLFTFLPFRRLRICALISVFSSEKFTGNRSKTKKHFLENQPLFRGHWVRAPLLNTAAKGWFH